jgi:hypothetical protein
MGTRKFFVKCETEIQVNPVFQNQPSMESRRKVCTYKGHEASVGTGSSNDVMLFVISRSNRTGDLARGLPDGDFLHILVPGREMGG